MTTAKKERAKCVKRLRDEASKILAQAEEKEDTSSYSGHVDVEWQLRFKSRMLNVAADILENESNE